MVQQKVCKDRAEEAIGTNKLKLLVDMKSKQCTLTEWRENRTDAQRKAKMLRERKTRLPKRDREAVSKRYYGPETTFTTISHAALQLCSPCPRTYEMSVSSTISPVQAPLSNLLGISAPYSHSSGKNKASKVHKY